MNIAIIGKGKVGSALGARLASAGHKVVYGSRAPEDHAGTVSQAESVQGAEVVVTAVPGTAVVPTLEAIGEDVLADRIVLDVSAAFTPDMALAYPNDSVARRVQARFPRARVVKSLNTMNYTIMVDPLASLSQATVFVSGDSQDAKATVKELLADLGWTTKSILDLGGVESATATEHLAPLFFSTYAALQTMRFNITISR
ncbi:NADPH-dependent F420 reductase [Actinocorallia aurantiaca]|uniref:NAD(P)-binding domain-containing protein n=1 Tax=Actinocorallia aurantiaca TaxID=46204 RepID=A0ABP6H4Q4_9ACTN